MVTKPGITSRTVREIVAIGDPVLRNLLITHGYYELSSWLAQMLGVENANWCTYAVWASKTAGVTIRDQELPSLFRGILENKGRPVPRASLIDGQVTRSMYDRAARIGDHAAKLQQELRAVHEDADLYSSGHHNVIGEAIDEVGLYIGVGNKIVFAELGLLFAEFMEAFEGATEPEQSKLDEFLGRLKPGAPMADKVELTADRQDLITRQQGGQGFLQTVVECYYKALFEPDGKRKAELILLGNAAGGLHEQTRLQPYVAGAIDAPVYDILLERHSAALRDRLEPRFHETVLNVLHRWFKHVGEEVLELFQEFSTVFMMQMKIPGETLRLSRNIPAPRGRPLFPAILFDLDNTDLVEDLREYGAYDAAGRDLGWLGKTRTMLGEAAVQLRVFRPMAVGSAASDWCRLYQRMRFIFPYFRTRQRDRSLQQPPFTTEQTAALLDGRIPDGPL